MARRWQPNLTILKASETLDKDETVQKWDGLHNDRKSCAKLIEVGECQLSKKLTRLEVAKALRCVGRGHTWRDRSPSSSHENLNAMEMSPRGDMVQRIVVE
ncbi:hypothetical protein B296_00042672 [Ensete ventricosum]|uniref:Uncharacterized protein n=1 Tax=Ensete ventricosum TaxID=4639 RepID=A0A426YP41_ENSVE|nr:hypothetical protein B296_00042672 [Ensete ventricosum]